MGQTELRNWVAQRLYSYQTLNGSFEYRYRSESVCKTMWMRLYGLGGSVMRNAHTMVRSNSSVSVHGKVGLHASTKDDRIYALLFLYFVDNCETIADGFWHLQALEDFSAIYEWITANWKTPRLVWELGRDESVPGEGSVRSVIRHNFKHVRYMRKGEYGICQE